MCPLAGGGPQSRLPASLAYAKLLVSPIRYNPRASMAS